MATAGTKQKKSPQISQVIPIYFSLVTDGPVPGEANLLHISAEFSPELKFSVNILPQKKIRSGVGIGQELQTRLAEGAVPMREALRLLVGWLGRFEGDRLAVTSALPYWHLIWHIRQSGMEMPLLYSPVDVGSFYAGAYGDLLKKKLIRGKDPSKALAQRKSIIADAIEKAKEIKW